MEIANNLVQTLSVADSPNQLSEGNPQAKNTKKKSATDDTSFDGTLLAQIATQPQTKAPGQGDAGLLDQLNQQAATQVALSTKNTAKAEEGGAPAPTIASLFQAKAEKDVNGTMVGAFVAGPDQPWNSRWVFGADKLPQLENMNAATVPGGKPNLNLDQLKKLIADVKAQGGDESQLKQAAESTLQELDTSIAALGGELQSVRTEKTGVSPKGQMNSLGGAEFLAALQGVKTAQAGEAGGQLGNEGGNASQNGLASEMGIEGLPGAKSGTALKAGKLAANAKPELQVIPGGLSSGAISSEGSLKSIKDESKLTATDSFLGAAPMAAVRHSDQGAGMNPPVLTGHVVPGAMQRDRLTSESVRNMANSMANLTPAGGGEMRIKLNPGNLGELMIRVSTNGKDVGLKVHASDAGAKKVIEESLGALRDSLASQSLALGRVDVSIITKDSAATDTSTNSQNSQHQQGAATAFDAQAGMQNRSNERFYGREENSNPGIERSTDRVAASRVASLAAQAASPRSTSSTRLDVMA